MLPLLKPALAHRRALRLRRDLPRFPRSPDLPHEPGAMDHFSGLEDVPEHVRRAVATNDDGLDLGP